MKSLLLALTLATASAAAAACHHPTAPAEVLAHCSLTIPTGYLCFQPCPANTEAWASGTLPYSPTNLCGGATATRMSPTTTFLRRD